MSTSVNLFASILLALGIGMAAPAHAALHDRGSGLLYDDVLNVTWLQDANYAKTSGFSSNGLMDWDQAMSWVDSLSYYDSVRGVSYNDWRLPNMRDLNGVGCSDDSDCGFNVVTHDPTTGVVYSELAYMYHENLGLKTAFDSKDVLRPDFGIFGNGTDSGQNDVGLVRNLQAHVYWSSLVYAPEASQAWYFATATGLQYHFDKGVRMVPWAVRDGDVAAVPEVDVYAMFIVGLGVLGGLARRRR